MHRCNLQFRAAAWLAALSWLALLAGCANAHARGERLREKLGQRGPGQAAPFRPAQGDVKRDIAYKQAGGTDLALDLYLPAGNGPHPVALYIHGGGWTEGGKAMGAPLCSALAARGYLAASVDYRLAGAAMWPAQIEDCRDAAIWLQEHAAEYGGDPEQLVVTGGSAGGQLALSLAIGWGSPGAAAAPTEAKWAHQPLRACCSWYGPTDLRGLAVFDRSSENIRQYLGADRATRSANAAEASPILYVDRGDCPVLFIHGTADPLVPIAQSRQLEAKLQEAGVTARLIEVEGGSHGVKLGTPEELRALTQQMIDWFDSQLGRSS
jgi:acetyl esterase/lipase